MQAGGAIMVRELDLDDVPDLVRSLLDDRAAPRADGRGDAARGAAGRRRGDRRGADRACPADERAAGSGSSASAAPGCPPTRSSRGRGGPRSAAGTACETPYLEPLDGVAIEISPEPVVPDGWEAVVSSAYPDVPGLRRAGVPRASSSRRAASIVVGGTHGKGTTAAMIAFALRETGGDPAWLIGAPVPQLGSNAGAGAGWLVVEGDESDRTVFALPAEIAVVTNVELDHHSEFASLAELEARVRPLARRRAARRARRAAVRGRARAAGRAQPAERGRGARGARARGRRARRTPRRALARFTGHRPAVRGARGRRRDDRRRLRPPPDRDRSDDRGRARAVPGRRAARALPAAPLLAHAASRAPSSPTRSRRPTTSTVTDVYLAREQPIAGRHAASSSSMRSPTAACSPRWTPTVEQGAPRLRRRARAGRRAARARRRRRRPRASALLRAASVTAWTRTSPLARYTTIGTGGPARCFARPATLDELQELLRWATRARRAASRRSGSARTCSPHDDGVDALVLKLAGELAAGRVEGEVLVAGGGAANAVCLHRARDAGLGGFEFASAIPGTAGGGVRMNAGAYGRRLARRADRRRRRRRRRRAHADARPSSSSRYRHSSLGPGEVVAAGALPARAAARPTASRRATAELLAQRKATQPTNKRTFGSVFKNPRRRARGRAR